MDGLADMYYCEQQHQKVLDEKLADKRVTEVKLTKLATQECNAAAGTGERMQMAA